MEKKTRIIHVTNPYQQGGKKRQDLRGSGGRLFENQQVCPGRLYGLSDAGESEGSHGMPFENQQICPGKLYGLSDAGDPQQDRPFLIPFLSPSRGSCVDEKGGFYNRPFPKSQIPRGNNGQDHPSELSFSCRNMMQDAYSPPLCILFRAVFISTLLNPFRIFRFGNTKFLAPDVSVTLIRCPSLKV